MHALATDLSEDPRAVVAVKVELRKPAPSRTKVTCSLGVAGIENGGAQIGRLMQIAEKVQSTISDKKTSPMVGPSSIVMEPVGTDAPSSTGCNVYVTGLAAASGFAVAIPASANTREILRIAGLTGC